MKTILSMCLFLLLAWTVSAKEPQPLISKPGKLLLSEDFSGGTIPKNWKPGGRPNAFAVVDGTLQGTCPADDAHGPWCGVAVDGRNLTIEFSIKSIQPGVFLLLVDGDSQFGGQAHLLRLALHGGGTALQQDRGSPVSKREQAAARATAAAEHRSLPPPSKQQLADPKFYRTEVLARSPARLLDGKCHRVLIEMRGNEVAAQIDELPALRAQSTVADVKKRRSCSWSDRRPRSRLAGSGSGRTSRLGARRDEMRGRRGPSPGGSVCDGKLLSGRWPTSGIIRRATAEYKRERGPAAVAPSRPFALAGPAQCGAGDGTISRLRPGAPRSPWRVVRPCPETSHRAAARPHSPARRR